MGKLSVAKTGKNASPAKATAAPRGGRKVAPRQSANAAISILARCKPATTAHGYIKAKQGRPDGMYVAPKMVIAGQNVEGWLAIPITSPDGQLLRSMQFISPEENENGKFPKLNLGLPFAEDGMHTVGENPKAKTRYIVEGPGQAWAVNNATDCPASITFGVGHTKVVAEKLRKMHPGAEIVIVADAGQEAGAERVAEAINGSWVPMPEGVKKNYDANDFALETSHADLADWLRDNVQHNKPTFILPKPYTFAELNIAKLTPDCIVESMLYADVGLFAAPGGVGKTTMLLLMAISIALGRALFGKAIYKSGAVVIVTAEDSRNMLYARLLKIMEGMALKHDEMNKVLQRVYIVDVSGTGFRLTQVVGDVVVPSPQVDILIEACRTSDPVLVTFDPAISFGVGESRPNDSEQGLVEAGRRIRNELGCGVLYVHHTGKVNSDNKNLDQYGYRGGSAFGDGSRMVWVMHRMSPEELQDETGIAADSGINGIQLALPKISFCPTQNDILIIREGWVFKRAESLPNSKEAKSKRVAEQVYRFIYAQFTNGIYYSQNTLMNDGAEPLALSQKQIRGAVSWLKNNGPMLKVEDLPSHTSKRGGAHDYLHPLVTPPEELPHQHHTNEKGAKNGGKF
ncbi:MAG: AAA family ATPase [Gallionella sp.]